jgi:hypothetical protein
MGKTTKRFSMVLIMVVLVVSFSIPFMTFPPKVYATTGSSVSIGDSYEGGIVAYIYVSGDPGYVAGQQNGIIMAEVDQSTDTSWSNITDALVGGTSVVLGAGKTNTAAIIAQAGHTTSAAKLCDGYASGGYTDWFMPSLNEMSKMYEGLDISGSQANWLKYSFDAGGNYNYWTSSEDSASSAHRKNMHYAGGTSVISQKSEDGFKVRAIRYFSIAGSSSPSDSPTSSSPRALTPEEIVALNLTIQQQVDRYGATNNGFVRMLYDNALGRVYDGGGFGFWTGELTANTMTGSQIAYHFIFSAELAPTINSLSDNEFIAFLYQTLMNRSYDSEGYANWQQHFESGMTREEMVNYFVNSPEFAGICASFNVAP